MKKLSFTAAATIFMLAFNGFLPSGALAEAQEEVAQEKVASSKLSADEQAFFEAVRGNKWNKTEMFLKKGANVNITDERGRTPLLAFAQDDRRSYAKTSFFKMLVDAGSDVNAKDNDGNTVLITITNKERCDLAFSFIHEGSFGCLKDTEGFYETVSFLVSKGADINAVAKNGKTVNKDTLDLNNLLKEAFFEAVKENDWDSTIRLIEAGIDVNVTDERGRTPLLAFAQDYEFAYQYSRFFKMLINAGADVNAKDNDGNTTLIQITNEPRCNDSPKFIRLRLMHVGYLPTDTEWCYETIYLLISEGADINAVAKNGKTVNKDTLSSIKLALFAFSSRVSREKHKVRKMMYREARRQVAVTRSGQEVETGKTNRTTEKAWGAATSP